MKYLGEQICAESDDEYGKSAEYGLFAAELLAEPARGDGGDCGGGGKGGGHDGCLSGGLMKNLIRKQSEEGGDGVRAAEEEEQTHEHEDKASSLAGGELLFLSRFFFGLCGLFFSLASCLCVGCLIHLALYLNAAVGLLDEEEDDEHTDYHNGGAEQENVGEGVELVELGGFRGDSRNGAVDSSDDSAREQAECSAYAAHEVDDGVALGANLARGKVGHERNDGSSPERHDKDKEYDEEHRQRERIKLYRN